MDRIELKHQTVIRNTSQILEILYYRLILLNHFSFQPPPPLLTINIVAGMLFLLVEPLDDRSGAVSVGYLFE